MPTYNRRELGMLGLAGGVAAMPLVWSIVRERPAPPVPPKIDSTINGVRIGVETYSYRDIGDADALDRIIESMVQLGLGECEMFSGTLAHLDLGNMNQIGEVADKFRDAGIEIYAYAANFGESEKDASLQFLIARTLGASIVTHSGTLSRAREIVPLANSRKAIVAMHGHDRIDDPNEFATPESFAAALAMSEYYRVNLDIGHFTASGFDPVAYIRQNHDRITNLHLKDRKRNRGPNMPWGEGDTPIKEVLQLLKQEKYPIRAYIEYEHQGTASPHEEVKRCLDFVRAALA